MVEFQSARLVKRHGHREMEHVDRISPKDEIPASDQLLPPSWRPSVQKRSDYDLMPQLRSIDDCTKNAKGLQLVMVCV